MAEGSVRPGAHPAAASPPEDAAAAFRRRFGVRRVINARGNVTVLGGSTLDARVRAAMDEANAAYVDMEEFLRAAGRRIAERLGAPAAMVTSGCFAALVLGAVAIMTGRDPALVGRLPDASGLRRDFLIQAPMRYRYDRAVTVPGGRLVEVGDARAVTAAALDAAIGPQTAGILYAAREEGQPGTLSIPDVVRIARTRGVAVLIDAAAEVYPLERMTWLAGASGADLVCFGAKYFGSLQSTGILCGRPDLVEAAFAHSFIGYEVYENRSIGRGYKVDRQGVAAAVTALEAWFEVDHDARLAEQARRIRTIAQALDGLPHVQAEPTWPRQGAWMQLRITLDPAGGRTPAGVERALREGDPGVWVRLDGDDLNVCVHTLADGEEHVVARRLRQVLAD